MTERREIDGEWRPIPGWPLYEVSSSGEVRSFHPRWMSSRSVTRGQPRILSQHLAPGGHPRVAATGDDGQKNPLVSALMARAFFDARSVVHLDGDASNNRLENLSPTDGMHETVSIVRSARQGRLTAEEALSIVADRKAPAAVKVSDSMAWQIRRGAKWRTVVGSGAAPRPDTAAARARAYCAEHPDAEPCEVARALGISPQSAGNVCRAIRAGKR